MKLKNLRHWYTKQPVIIALLIFFAPVGLLLMWNFARWSKLTKAIVSIAMAVVFIAFTTSVYNSSPSLNIDNVKAGRISTDTSEYTLTGSVSSMKTATLIIDGHAVPIEEDINFSYKVVLKEGDNTFDLVASNENGKTKEVVIVHRATQAELEAKTKKDAPVAKSKNSTPKLKHSYDDFYEWVTTDRQDAMLKNIGNPYQIITATCQEEDGSYGSVWIACMQEGYKNYLKPSVFVDDNWQGDYSTMMGYINDALAQKSWHGATSVTNEYKKDMQEAEKIYNQIALTD